MYDISPPLTERADPKRSRPALQRAQGQAWVAVSHRGGATRLDGLRQQGCAKAFLPRGSGAPEIVFLNTSGGLTGGDKLAYRLDVGSGAVLTATTQTAERAYRATASEAPGELCVSAEVAAGARLDWLPQETILYDGAALTRRTDIALSGDATLLMCEALVLGRAAMGERVTGLRLFDRRAVSRDGQPVLIDAVALDDATVATAGQAALLGRARAVAMLALVARGAEDAAGALRALSWPEGVTAGISGWDGKCVLRLTAPDGWPLRLALAKALRHLRGTHAGGPAALPRVWQI